MGQTNVGQGQTWDRTNVGQEKRRTGTNVGQNVGQRQTWDREEFEKNVMEIREKKLKSAIFFHLHLRMEP